MLTVEGRLRNAEAARGVVVARSLVGDLTVQAQVEDDVCLQLAHLRTHPSVVDRLAEGGK